MFVCLFVDLLVQEKRRVSFMYFCTHENINVFISTDSLLSFPNNKLSIFIIETARNIRFYIHVNKKH